MIRKTIALGLLLAGTAAGAQEGGSVSISSGPGDFQFVPGPVIEPGSLQNVFVSSQVYFVASPDGLIGAAMRQGERVEPPLVLDRDSLQGDPIRIGVEGDGVRLPDEQFSLP